MNYLLRIVQINTELRTVTVRPVEPARNTCTQEKKWSDRPSGLPSGPHALARRRWRRVHRWDGMCGWHTFRCRGGTSEAPVRRANRGQPLHGRTRSRQTDRPLSSSSAWCQHVQPIPIKPPMPCLSNLPTSPRSSAPKQGVSRSMFTSPRAPLRPTGCL